MFTEYGTVLQYGNIYIYIFRFKSYLLTRVARIEIVMGVCVYRVVNKFVCGVADMMCKSLCNAKPKFLNCRDGWCRGEV